MSRIKILSLVMTLAFSFGVLAQRKEVREVYANDREMKTIHLTLGRSTILSFGDKPVKVVSGNSNYFNVEYIGNDLTLQPLANVETNLFVYTQNKMKYGFHLKVGSSAQYDDIVYVRWKLPSFLEKNATKGSSNKVQKLFKPQSLKLGSIEIQVNNLIHLKGSKSYIVDFDVKNKGTSEIKHSELDVFVSRNNERLKGQKLFFKKDNLPIHDSVSGRILLPIEKNEDFSLYVSFQKKLNKVVISKSNLR